MAHPAQTAPWPPLTLQPPPHPALSTVKRMRREHARGRGRRGRGAFNWIIPSAVITPIVPKRPAIMEPCKRNFLRGRGGAYTVLAGIIPAPVRQLPMPMSLGEFVQLHLQYKSDKSLSKFRGNFTEYLFQCLTVFLDSRPSPSRDFIAWHQRLFILLF